MFYKIFVSIILLTIILIVLFIVYEVKSEIKRRKNAKYIRDRITGEIHIHNCSRVKKIPKNKRQYLDEWDFRYMKHRSKTHLKYCRKCLSVTDQSLFLKQ